MCWLLLWLWACGSNGGEVPLSEAPAGEVTYHKDVAPIVAEHCAACHGPPPAPGGFSLTTYEEITPWASLALQKMEGDTSPPYLMPPWHAQETPECVPPAPFLHDERVSTAELDLFRAWVEGGAPEGDPEEATHPVPPSPFVVEDQELYLDHGVSLEAGRTDDQYKCIPLDPGLSQTEWITALQVDPDAQDVVHHVVVFADPYNEGPAKVGPDGAYDCFGGSEVTDEVVLFAWAPGSQPLEVPEGAGIPMPAGAGLIMQVHYHPTGEPVVDQTRLQVNWTQRQPAKTLEMRVYGVIFGDIPELVDPPFLIPAGAKGHVEQMRFPISEVGTTDVRIWSMFAHMHLAGTDIRVGLEHGQEETCLHHNPAWDFNWQRTYAFDAPFDELPRVQDGDVLTLRCTYDNTEDNPILDEYLEDLGGSLVPFVGGENTTDEMCVAIVGILY